MSAQTPPMSAQPQQAPEAPITLRTELVVLDVEVLEKKTGRAVSNLRKEEFRVYEDKVQQEILHFSRDTLPLSIVLLLDFSGSVQPMMKEIKDAALQALARLKPEDEVAVMAFAMKTQLLQDFSTDKQLSVKTIELSKDEARQLGGVTFINEAVYQAATHLSKAANPVSRRVIIAITDNQSNQLPHRGHSEKQALDELVESGTTVCGIIVRSGLAKVDNVLRYNPMFMLTGKILGFGSIRTYAAKTDGIVVGANKTTLEERFIALINRLRARYTIGYVSSNTSANGKFRKIQLKLAPAVEKREGKVAVLTRQGYYARRRPDEEVKR